jgi:hypothetical protein
LPVIAVIAAARVVLSDGSELSVTASDRYDGPRSGQRILRLRLHNTGDGPARDARIDAAGPVAVTLGSGSVRVLSRLPASCGTLARGESADLPLLLDWPAPAQQVRFLVHFSANGGAAAGATSLTVFR